MRKKSSYFRLIKLANLARRIHELRSMDVTWFPVFRVKQGANDPPSPNSAVQLSASRNMGRASRRPVGSIAASPGRAPGFNRRSPTYSQAMSGQRRAQTAARVQQRAENIRRQRELNEQRRLERQQANFNLESDNSGSYIPYSATAGMPQEVQDLWNEMGATIPAGTPSVTESGQPVVSSQPPAGSTPGAFQPVVEPGAPVSNPGSYAGTPYADSRRAPKPGSFDEFAYNFTNDAYSRSGRLPQAIMHREGWDAPIRSYTTNPYMPLPGDPYYSNHNVGTGMNAGNGQNGPKGPTYTNPSMGSLGVNWNKRVNVPGITNTKKMNQPPKLY